MKDNNKTRQHPRYGVTRSRLRQIIPVTPMGSLGDRSKQAIERAFTAWADKMGDGFLQNLERGLIEDLAGAFGHQLAFSVITQRIQRMGPEVWGDHKHRVFRRFLKNSGPGGGS